MEIREVTCKNILTRASGYLKAVASHSVNPYIGCGFGRSVCGVGCYVQHNYWLTRGREWGHFVDVKINAPESYQKTWKREKSWAGKRGQPFFLFFSSSTDPWQPVEKKYRITRRLLETICDSPPDGIILQTHSDSIQEDRERIVELAQKCDLRVHLSIEGDRDRLPGLPPPPCSVEDRFCLIEDFSQADIPVVACLAPLFPLRDPHQFFSRLVDAGARAAVIDHFVEGDGTSDGSRTLKTPLPEAMLKTDPASGELSYRDKIVDIARTYLPTGVSRDGFAGNYLFAS